MTGSDGNQRQSQGAAEREGVDGKTMAGDAQAASGCGTLQSDLFGAQSDREQVTAEGIQKVHDPLRFVPMARTEEIRLERTEEVHRSETPEGASLAPAPPVENAEVGTHAGTDAAEERRHEVGQVTETAAIQLPESAQIPPAIEGQMPPNHAQQLLPTETPKCHQMPPNNTVDSIGLTDWWDFEKAGAFDAGEWGVEELWRIEKKGKGFIYVLRFIEQRITRTGGAITPYIARQIAKRPGRGRWGKSRKEASRLRRFAEHLAAELGQTPEGRTSGAVQANAARPGRNDSGGISMPDVLGGSVSDVSDVRGRFIN